MLWPIWGRYGAIAAFARAPEQRAAARLFYAWDAISFTTMAAGPVSIHFVCGETRRPAGNCFATPVLVGRDATAAIVVNEMRETAVSRTAGNRDRLPFAMHGCTVSRWMFSIRTFSLCDSQLFRSAPKSIRKLRCETR